MSIKKRKQEPESEVVDPGFTLRPKKRKQEPVIDQSFKLRPIEPKTEGQADVITAYENGAHLFLYGVAGTGKTFLSLFLALKDVLAGKKNCHTLYIVRSSVPSRDIGFLPGTAEEKMAAYEAPYRAMVNQLFFRDDAWQIAVAKGAIRFISTSYLRGITLDNCVVIFDEVQNCRFEELDTLITRVGSNCRLLICGDIEQTDLVRNRQDTTGLPRFTEIIAQMSSFRMIEFGIEDIVRSGLVKEYILAKRAIEHRAVGEPRKAA